MDDLAAYVAHDEATFSCSQFEREVVRVLELVIDCARPRFSLRFELVDVQLRGIAARIGAVPDGEPFSFGLPKVYRGRCAEAF